MCIRLCQARTVNGKIHFYSDIKGLWQTSYSLSVMLIATRGIGFRVIYISSISDLVTFSRDNFTTSGSIWMKLEMNIFQRYSRKITNRSLRFLRENLGGKISKLLERLLNITEFFRKKIYFSHANFSLMKRNIFLYLKSG